MHGVGRFNVFILSLFIYYLFILSLMLTVTEQILLTIKNSNKMLTDVKTLVENPIKQKHL